MLNHAMHVYLLALPAQHRPPSLHPSRTQDGEGGVAKTKRDRFSIFSHALFQVTSKQADIKPGLCFMCGNAKEVLITQPRSGLAQSCNAHVFACSPTTAPPTDCAHLAHGMEREERQKTERGAFHPLPWTFPSTGQADLAHTGREQKFGSGGNPIDLKSTVMWSCRMSKIHIYLKLKYAQHS